MMKKCIYNLQNQDNIALAENEVHIWNFDLDKIIVLKDKFKQILSEGEIHRAEKFHFEKDKNWFICSRGLLRVLVSAYSKISPKEIELILGDFGKPFLSPSQNINSLNFNLSHTKNFMSVGFVKDAQIGVDVELMKPMKDHLQIAQRFFSEAEINQLNKLPTDKILDGFYACWSAKESAIKLSGEGLSYPLQDFDVDIRLIDVGDSYNFTFELKSKKEILFVTVFRLRQDLFGTCAINNENSKFLHCGFEAEESSISYFLNKLTD